MIFASYIFFYLIKTIAAQCCRCLVSAMYDEAAEVAKSTLSVLVTDGIHESCSGQEDTLKESDDSEEIESMIEAAGMVLLQAINQKERCASFFSVKFGKDIILPTITSNEIVTRNITDALYGYSEFTVNYLCYMMRWSSRRCLEIGCLAFCHSS